MTLKEAMKRNENTEMMDEAAAGVRQAMMNLDELGTDVGSILGGRTVDGFDFEKRADAIATSTRRAERKIERIVELGLPETAEVEEQWIECADILVSNLNITFIKLADAEWEGEEAIWFKEMYRDTMDALAGILTILPKSARKKARRTKDVKGFQLLSTARKPSKTDGARTLTREQWNRVFEGTKAEKAEQTTIQGRNGTTKG